MATFSISAVARKAQATANGSTTEFSFSFSVNVEADVAVFVGTTLKTISTHYTVSITSSTGAGSITFTSGNTPTNGQIVTIMSKTALARSSVYTSGGTINATSLETDFDTNMMLFQQQDERLDRVITAPVDDATSIDMTLPNKDARKGTVLGFNATSGNPEAGPSITAVQSLADVTTAINLLGTSAVVEDLGILGTAAIVEDMGLLATSAVIEDMGLLATSAVIEDMGLLATSAVIEDMGLLATSSVISDMSTLAGSGANPNITSVTASGAVTAGSLVIGSADIAEAELEMIDGITAGTALASKAMVLDSAKDITGGRNLTISGELDAATLDISSTALVTGVLTANGGAIFNENSADVDFRVESNGNANMLFVDGGNDRVGIGTSSPSSAIEAVGSLDILQLTGTTGNAFARFTDSDASSDFSIGADDGVGAGSFILYDRNNTAYRLVVDSSGAVTMPSQPAFLAQVASAQTDLASYLNVVIFGTEIFDQNADFNPSNGIFTAPVTGKYMLSTFIGLDQIPATGTGVLQLQIAASNRTVYAAFDPIVFDATSTKYTFTQSLLLDMDASDTAKIQIYMPVSSSTVDINTQSFFSGYLVA